MDYKAKVLEHVETRRDFWPAFETAGVLVPVEGDPLLLIGSESLAYAESRSKIDNISSGTDGCVRR